MADFSQNIPILFRKKTKKNKVKRRVEALWSKKALLQSSLCNVIVSFISNPFEYWDFGYFLNSVVLYCMKDLYLYAWMSKQIMTMQLSKYAPWAYILTTSREIFRGASQIIAIWSHWRLKVQIKNGCWWWHQKLWD